MKARDLLDTTTARRVSVLADADPRTVDRVILGKPTRDSVRLRIMAALLDCGISNLVPLTPNTPSGAPSEEPAKP